jgi:hypothetical protein
VKKWTLLEIAELLGVVGVIGSLIFVALQVEQNTAAIRSQAAQGIQDQITAFYQMYVSDPTLSDLVLRTRSAQPNLTEEERVRFEGFEMASFAAYQNLFIQMREGVVDEEFARGWWQNLRNVLARPVQQEIWASNEFVFSPAFRQFVDTEVMRLEPTPAREVQQ